jgi:hypothetical protein
MLLMPFKSEEVALKVLIKRQQLRNLAAERFRRLSRLAFKTGLREYIGRWRSGIRSNRIVRSSNQDVSVLVEYENGFPPPEKSLMQQRHKHPLR